MDFREVVRRELEVADGEVLPDAFFVDGFRDGDDVFLQQPAEDDLCRRLAVRLADGGECRIGEDAALSFSERRPGHEADVIGLHDFAELLLLAERMRFHLVDGGHDVVRENQVEQAVGQEVADADGANLARFVQFLHRVPCAVVVAVGHVDEVEVEVVRAEVFKRLGE